MTSVPFENQSTNGQDGNGLKLETLGQLFQDLPLCLGNVFNILKIT